MATPTSYELGPGDELLIDIWGAAENNYTKQVNREGAIRIESIGPIYVSGLSIDKAKEKIISYLMYSENNQSIDFNISKSEYQLNLISEIFDFYKLAFL